MSRLTCLLTFLSCLIATTSAPTQQALSHSTGTLLASVLDKNGNAIRDLTRDNFRVRLNGKPATVVDASYSVAPRRIVVLLDMSGSMQGKWGATKWHIAQQATEDLIKEVPKDSRGALLSFSDQVHDVFDFSQDRAATLAWLKQGINRRSSVKGRTALFDAIVTASKILDPPREGDAIYLVTDGGDNRSHATAAEVKSLFCRSGTRLFVFLFSEPMITEEEQTGLDTVTELAVDSGGFVVGARARGLGSGYASWDVVYEYDDRVRAKIRQSAQALNTQANTFYTLRVEEPIADKDKKVKLEVIEKSGAVRKDVVYTYQRLLPATK